MAMIPSPSGGGGQQPYQFLPESYGARGDGKIGTGGTGTSGQNILTDAGASFTAADVGKLIVINQGPNGLATNPLCTTISGFTSSASVTLAASFGANAANAPYIYGTDDAAAINSAVSAAAAYAAANQAKAQIVLGARYYMLGALTQATTPTQYNCHIPVPVGTQGAPKLILEFIGPGDASGPQFWESTQPGLTGACLVSAVLATAQPNATFGQQSVIGGPTAITASIQPGNFANTRLVLSGVTLVKPYNGQQFGVDARRLSQLNPYPTAAAMTFVPVNLNSNAVGGPWFNAAANIAIEQNGISVAFAFPTWGNNADNNCGLISVSGWGGLTGIQFTEHFSAQRMLVNYCNNGAGIDSIASSTPHGAWIGLFACENCNQILNSTNSAANDIYPIYIDHMMSEFTNTAHVTDVNNNFSGQVGWSNSTSTRPVVTGGANLIVVDQSQHQTGQWTGAPAAPATTVNQQNLSYHWAMITLTATTGITQVQVGKPRGDAAPAMVTTGLTQASGGPAIQVRIAPGGWFNVTYPGVLTTTWFLD